MTSRDGNGDWQGRVQSLVLDGTRGNVTISGDSFRWAYGLRSNWFTIEPTPITRRWARLGGAKGRLGAVRSRELPIASGANQRFQRGRIFYSKRTGPRELYGPVLRTYNRTGGPKSPLGFPTTAVRPHGVKRFALFQNGGIYKRPGKGAAVVTGPIHDRYLKAGKWKSGLGWPMTSNFKVPRGQRVNFRFGHIRWDRKTGKTHLVRRG